MALDRTIRELASEQFLRLRQSTPLSAALAQLQSAETRYAVIVDESDASLSLVNAEDLERARQSSGSPTTALGEALRWLPPLIVVDPSTTLRAVVESPPFTLLWFGARGLVAEEEGKPVGVLPKGTLARLWPRPDTSRRRRGARSLAGVPAVRRARIVCARCGMANEVDFFDDENPPECVNTAPPPGPHRLKPA